MQITLNKTDLIDKLELVGKVSTKHATLPVLQCVLLKVAEGEMSINATNLEIGIESKIKGEVSEEGSVAVPAQTLIQTIHFINQPKVTLRVEESVLVIESKGSETSIKTIPYEEFPNIPKIESSGQVVNKSLFSLGIKTASFAASQSSIKPELGSVYILQKKEHTLTFVATDSFRLMEKTVSQKNFVLNESILIPQKNALELARVCDLMDSDPEFKINENQCALAFSNGVYITSRLTSGSFPDYEQIIPKEYSTHTTLLKNDLLQALKKTNIFLNKFMQIKLHLTEKSCTISANNGEVGTTTESVTAQTEGEDLQLNFNQRYLLEPLGYLGDESIVMHFAGIGRPLVINGVHDNTLRYLVMPMNK
ncbi:DNA polymerase III subunit beta [Candidatus Kaiserbacteria bacterium]|nr:DNA polymerase III subunit beta [Candidatus Kaiserbacteria bacterium]